MSAAAMQSSLSSVATGREASFFADDMAEARHAIEAGIRGRRVLAIGGAGSIGSSTVRVLADHGPAALHVVDQNENELAELVRGLRSRAAGLDVASFRTLPLDYGSPAMRALLEAEAPYDLILNFAAIKHVRSEKDAFSALQMFDTNLVKQARLLRWLAAARYAGRYFSVSTDKAANPSSMMGASKRAMEHVMFDAVRDGLADCTVTSARFANVAFSNGSLLQSFERRLKAGEPLAAPRDTRRYFVSLGESGEICALASLVLDGGLIGVPKLDPEDHLVPMQAVAERFLALHGYEAAPYEDEDAARREVAAQAGKKRWPLLLTPLDTAGEKPFEEFVAAGETIEEVGLPNMAAVRHRMAADGAVERFVAALDAMFARGAAGGPMPDKDVLKALLADLEPEFARTHRDSARSLDDRV